MVFKDKEGNIINIERDEEYILFVMATGYFLNGMTPEYFSSNVYLLIVQLFRDREYCNESFNPGKIQTILTALDEKGLVKKGQENGNYFIRPELGIWLLAETIARKEFFSKINYPGFLSIAAETSLYHFQYNSKFRLMKREEYIFQEDLPRIIALNPYLSEEYQQLVSPFNGQEKEGTQSEIKIPNLRKELTKILTLKASESELILD